MTLTGCIAAHELSLRIGLSAVPDGVDDSAAEDLRHSNSRQNDFFFDAQDLWTPLQTRYAGMGRVLSLVIFAIFAVFLYYEASLPNPFVFLRRQAALNVCDTASFQWRGANEKIFPQSGRPVKIRHNDYTDNLLTQDINILLARSLNEDFSIETEIRSSHELPIDSFEISYANDELIINTMVGKRSDIIINPLSAGQKHCVTMKIQVLIPVSKPLTGLVFEFPKANFFVHESAHGSLPSLVVDITKGNIIFAEQQRLHTEMIALRVDEGRVEGTIMITKSLSVHLRQGEVNVDLSYSPYLIGAELDIQQDSGAQTIRLSDYMYRPTSGQFSLQNGPIYIQYPKSYEGSISLDSKTGRIELKGPDLEVIERSERGIKPTWIEAQQGRPDATTRIRNDNGGIEMELAAPGSEKSRPELISS